MPTFAAQEKLHAIVSSSESHSIDYSIKQFC